MKPQTRAAIAFILAARNRPVNSVFDHATGRRFQFSGTVGERSINVYDYEQGCHIAGSGDPHSVNLYHYGNGTHITLSMKNGGFTGYDYDTGDHFMGNVQGSRVNLYDYGEGRYFNFTA